GFRATMPDAFSERDFSASQFFSTQETEPDRIEDVEPVPASPRQNRKIPRKERISVNHGFGQGLLRLLIPAEVRLYGGGQIAVNAEALPPSPGLDIGGKRPQILAQ